MKVITSVIFAISLFLSVFLTTSAQSGNEYTGALLWKVSGNGLAEPSYIPGTHHLIHVSFVDSIPGLRDAMEKTQQTVGELLLSDPAAFRQEIQKAAMMPAGESYSGLLSAEEYKTLDEGLKAAMGAGLEQMGRFKPGMISMVYAIALYTKLYPQFNSMSHEAIDSYVQRIAKESGKTVLGLETVDDQIHALFDAEPLKDQAKSLACSVKNQDTEKDQLDKLNACYKAGDLIGMYDLAFNNPDELCKMSQIQQKAINKNRNDKWVASLPEIMKNKPSLIVAGALHLAGKEGVLYQLAKKGYAVEFVK
ncbi:MAG: TraB/GumN family protein [Prevotella sp.]|jgi:uncharacterized protein YbaP (TraB family)|nr:TraB/GumN family protein [Prevotella sp.]